MTKPTSAVEHADGLMRKAEVLFRDKESIMKSDYRDLAEDHMQ
jgi:hypothetical protein